MLPIVIHFTMNYLACHLLFSRAQVLRAQFLRQASTHRTGRLSRPPVPGFSCPPLLITTSSKLARPFLPFGC